MGPALDGLPKKSMHIGEACAIPRDWLVLGGAVSPGPTRIQMSKHQIKNSVVAPSKLTESLGAGRHGVCSHRFWGSHPSLQLPADGDRVTEPSLCLVGVWPGSFCIKGHTVPCWPLSKHRLQPQ